MFHDYIVDIKDEMFDGAADVIMARLSKAAEAVGKALETALSDLAETVRHPFIYVFGVLTDCG